MESFNNGEKLTETVLKPTSNGGFVIMMPSFSPKDYQKLLEELSIKKIDELMIERNINEPIKNKPDKIRALVSQKTNLMKLQNIQIIYVGRATIKGSKNYSMLVGMDDFS